MKKTATMKADELFHLLRANKLEKIKTLLDSDEKYEVNVKNNQGESLLMVATKELNLDALKMLTQYSINYEVVNNVKHYALHYSMYQFYHFQENLDSLTYLEKCLTLTNTLLNQHNYSYIDVREDLIIEPIKDKVLSLIQNYQERQIILKSISSQEYFDIKQENKIIKKVKI